jgi:GR25 family glycosyltransferase involved in LPS biosynthesis
MKYVVILICVLLVLFVLSRYYGSGRIVSTHVINMKSSTERYNKFMERARGSGLEVTRWDAVNGKTMTREESKKNYISDEIYEKHKSKKRMGVIGCYLSHALLLQHLETMPCSPNDIHCVFEDDIVLTDGVGGKIKDLIAQLPPDWDFVQLYTLWPRTKQCKGALCKPLPNRPGDEGNMSTAAYVVRHGALSKINNHIRVMRVPIDNQLAEKAHVWNWYVVQPDLLKVDETVKTTLNDAPPQHS